MVGCALPLPSPPANVATKVRVNKCQDRELQLNL